MQRHVLKSIGAALIFLVSGAAWAAVQPLLPDVPIPKIDPGRVKQSLEPSGAALPTAAGVAIPILKPPVAPSQDAKIITFLLKQIVLDGATVYKPAELAPLYQKYLGTKISLADLQLITNAITIKYRQDGYFSSQAVVPPQNIKDGVVHIKVLEGYISDIIIDGDASGAKDYLLHAGEVIKKKRPVNINELERCLLLANDLPGFTVKSLLRPAAHGIGGSDLVFIVQRDRVDLQASYDNRGTAYIGPQQASASIALNDAFGHADTLILRAVTTPASNDMRFTDAEYAYPLGSNGLNFLLTGSYVETRPGFTLDSLDLAGRSASWGAGFSYPLIRSRRSNLATTLKFDWLDSETNLPTSTLFMDHLRSLRLGVNYDRLDDWRGLNSASLEYSKGLQAFGASRIDDPNTITSRSGAKIAYNKAQASLSRLQRVSSNLNLLLAFKGQYSFNESFLSAEEFGFGGAAFGRGYDSSEITGDSGIAGKMELRLNTTPGYLLLQNVLYYVFYDAGQIWNVGDSGQTFRDNATSAGIGTYISFNKYLLANLELAKPLTHSVQALVSANKDGNALRGYFSISAMF